MELSSDREKVEFFLSCRSLKNMDVFSKSDPQIILFIKTPSNQWHEFGRTEMIKDNLNPNFSKTFLMDYIFETQQHIKFDVIDIDSKTSFDFIGSVATTVGHIVGAKNQMAVLDISDKSGKKTGKLIVRAEKVGSCRETLGIKIRGKNLADLHFFHKTSPFLRFLKISEDGMQIKVHETEYYHSNLNPVFQPFELKLQKLCNGDHLRPIRIELWDYNSNGEHKIVGNLDFTIHQISAENKKEFQLKDPSKKKIMGSIIFEQATLISKPEFIDYLRGGVQLSLIVAIDFTGSNGVPSRPDSLHALRPNGEKNQYQQAISAVGEILLNYDYDKKVPVYGFGGKPKLPHFFSNVALHCFPCNGNPQDPEVFGLEGIEMVYNQILPNVELAGPTLFAPLIEETMKLADACKNSGSKVYNILLILTDGEINDMDKSAAAIIDAAYLPLSIIIIGIGNADFGKMEYLDGDDGLVDSSGRKAKRDLVQFVPFNKFKGNPAKLAESVLEELPTQLCEYMRMLGIKPDAPQIIDINNMKFSVGPNIGGPPIGGPGMGGPGMGGPGMGGPGMGGPGMGGPGMGGPGMGGPGMGGPGMGGKNLAGPTNMSNYPPVGLNDNPAAFGGAPKFGSMTGIYGANPQNMNYARQQTNEGGNQGYQAGYGQRQSENFGYQPQQQPGYQPQQQQPRVGANTMAFGQNFMTGFLQQNNQGNQPGQQRQLPGGNNVLPPTGKYYYGN